MIHWLRRLLPRHTTYQSEIAEEIAYHLDQRTRALIAQGLSPTAARAQAELEFGNVNEARHELAAIDRRHAQVLQSRAWRTDVKGDVRQGLRLFRKSPGFSVLLLLIVALAIGANSASFTVLRATLVNGLPYANPDKIVHLWETSPEESGHSGHGLHRSEASYPDFLDWRNQTTAFTQLEGYDQTNLTIASAAGVAMRPGAYVTPGFFDLLGVQPILGRSFQPDENVPNGLPLAILSYGFWQSRFGGDPAVLDSSILLDGSSFRIVGVLPADFHFAPIGSADVWMPLNASPTRREQRFNHWLRVIGRLQPGATMERAQSEMSLVMNRLAEQYPETNQGRDAAVVPLRDQLLGNVQPVLVALFVAMGLVLLIACANIAGLLLARALGREQEIQVRAALGASRWRLARQLIVESLIFVLLGAMLGTLLGQYGVQWVLGALPEGVLDHLPALRTSRLDWSVMGYTAVIAMVTGLAFGLGPILHAMRSTQTVSASNRTTANRGLKRLRDLLIVGEIALTLVLLAGTALVGRSLLSLLRQELGFRTESIYTARVALGGPEYATAAPNQRFFESLVSELRSVPEMGSVGAVSQLPLNSGGTNTLHLEGTAELPAPERPAATTRLVVGDYFQTIGIPLVTGRFFTPRDDSLARPVVVVSETLARVLEPSGKVLGRQVRFYSDAEATWEIIGIAGDVRTGSLELAPPPTIYLSHLQVADNRMSLVIRSTMSETGVAERVRTIVRALDPDVPVYASGKLSDVVSDAPAVATRRVPFILLSVFAGSALILAVVGLYGVVSYSVARRTRELGIRMALGAAPRQILLDVLRYGSVLALVGTGLGVLVAAGLSRLVRGLLFGVGPIDVIAYGGSALLLIVVTMLATFIPARRATRVDPTVALKE